MRQETPSTPVSLPDDFEIELGLIPLEPTGPRPSALPSSPPEDPPQSDE